jgi:hypothetical protein
MVLTSTLSLSEALDRGLNLLQTRSLRRGCAVVAVNTTKSAWKVRSLRAAVVLSWMCVGLFGCDAWPGGSDLRVEGATPYVRCLAYEPPADGVKRIGGARIRTRSGAIAIEGLRAPVTVAAFSGPGFEPPARAAIEALAAARPQLALMLGGVGDTPAIALSTLVALAGLPVPTLILAGGRDSPGRIEHALEGLKAGAADRITDVTATISVSIGNDTFIPIAGSLGGHYALDADACGYGESDLRSRAANDAVPPKSRRWLLAWDAPASDGDFAVSRAGGGLALGSAPLGELARALGARGGLFAWPETQVLRPSAGGHRPATPGVPHADLQLVVPRLSGPPIERSDGSRVPPGFALLRLDSRGLSLISAHASR